MLRLTSLAAAALIASAALSSAQQPNPSVTHPNGYANQERSTTSTTNDRGFLGLHRHRAMTSRRAPGPADQTAMGAGKFSSEGDARAHCGSDTVVWVNMKSRVYHLPGSRDFGQTQHGAFMCQADADRSGQFRAAKNEMRTQQNGNPQMPVSRFSGSTLNRR